MMPFQGFRRAKSKNKDSWNVQFRYQDDNVVGVQIPDDSKYHAENVTRLWNEFLSEGISKLQKAKVHRVWSEE